MTSNKPKGKTPSLIGFSSGRPCRVTVKRKSKCNRCGSNIETDQDCFGIPKTGGGFTVTKRHCKSCFKNIIQQTYKDLEEIENI